MEKAILLAGGYGVVGRQVAQIFRELHPNIPLILAGRNPDKAKNLVNELKLISTLELDINNPEPLEKYRDRLKAIVSIVNDTNNHLLKKAISFKIPYLDITKWTEEVIKTINLTKQLNPASPVMLSSAWMAGIVSFLVIAGTANLNKLNEIEIDILYSLKDKAGPNSAEYMDRLKTPYSVKINGKNTEIFPLTLSKKIDFGNNIRFRTYNLDTPEQFTLPLITNAKTVITRIAFDDFWSNKILAFLVKSGIWNLINGERFTRLRRSFLYNPGEGGEHKINIGLKGIKKDNMPGEINIKITDPKGQTHLTAVGAVLQMERLLGLDGAKAPKSGLLFPKTNPQIERGLKILSRFDISVEIG